MSIFSSIFKKEPKVKINSYEDFWNWFSQNENHFYEVIKSDKNVDKKFFAIIDEQLHQITKGLDLVAETKSDGIAELIFTVGGNVEKIAYAEDLVKTAPSLNKWRFLALIPEENETCNIVEHGHHYNENNVFFYQNENIDFPDEIDLTFVYTEPAGKNRNVISEGVTEFLKNYLGELNYTVQIDSYNIIDNDKAEQDLIPVTELKSFLQKKEQEFSQKYQGSYTEIGMQQLNAFEVFTQNGLPVRLLLNIPVLQWNKKSSYPWISVLRIGFSGVENGLPEQEDFDLMNQIDEEMKKMLPADHGHLYIGRETLDGTREVYFASKDFRDTTRVFNSISKKYAEDFTFSNDIFKDKYWKYFVKYNVG